MRPITATEEWATNLAPDQAISRATAEFEHRGAEVVRSESGLRAHAGSRWGFRLYGAYMKAGRQRLPWQATLHVTAGEEESRAISMTICSDLGLYLFVIPRVTREYEWLVSEMITSMRRATTGHHK